MEQRTPARQPVIRTLAVALALFLVTPVFGSAASATNPTQVYFPQTGHVLANGFLQYWRENGGLMMFGYPLTEEMSRDGLTVQYFERAVFEYHPKAPDGWKVQLRRLGADQTTANSDPAVDPATGSSDANCTFYAPTGHRLCFGFRDYWQNHGALAMFGYPISKEFQEKNPDTGQTYTVQYFERARFEYHPENAPEYQVLLGRLGYAAFLRDGVHGGGLPNTGNLPNYDPSLWTPTTCQPWQLSLTSAGGSAATGHREDVYAFQNTSQIGCTFYGYPGMQLYDATGAALPTTVIRGGAGEFRDVTPQTVTLAPGDQASFALGYTVIPTGTQTCPTSSRMLVTPPNDYTQLGLAAMLRPCGGIIHISPVVAGVPGPDAIDVY